MSASENSLYFGRQKRRFVYHCLSGSRFSAHHLGYQVEFKVNGQETDFAMKLGDGGEAFFVFETTGFVPEEMQTSPLVSPSASPRQLPTVPDPASLQEPEYLSIGDSDNPATKDSASDDIIFGSPRRVQSNIGKLDFSMKYASCSQ